MRQAAGRRLAVCVCLAEGGPRPAREPAIRLATSAAHILRIAAVVAATTFLAQSHASEALAAGKTSTLKKKTVADICPVPASAAKPGAALNPPIALSPTQQSAQKLVNFGTSRHFKVVRHLTVTTAKPLPTTVTPDQISFEASLARTGDTLESAEFPDPTFSRPEVSEDRQSISFSVCLNPEGVSAGKYVGLITVSGPPGLGPTSMNLTVNAKDKQLFTLSWLVALVGALALLWLKNASALKTGTVTWPRAFGKTLLDPLWWGATVAALVGAFGTLYNIWANDPAWGANGFAGLVSLFGAATAAVGAHAILTTFSKK